ncbi:MAG: hypothetical protein FJ104_03980, partial [Deltaproteobacteria bacterium]|nr:hypothetical protein [Deltaproteobacteria bacterium]
SSLWKDTSCTSSQRSVCEAAPVTGCASGQTASGSRCYKIDDGTETHAVHRADCQALGAGWDLAVIGDAAENAAIAAITSNSRDYHIGYTDEAVEGTWLTVGGAAPAYTAWWSEPDGGDSADCVFLGQAGDRWADGSCTTSRDYACEGPTNAVCPSGWTAVGARCMQAFSTNRNFASAEADCVTRGGHLATVESAAEVASVQGITGAGVAYWIGANDLTTEGAFAWTSGSASTYTNWPNAPDGGSAANCARMDAAGGTWQDDSCTDSGDSVCEGPKLNGCPSGWTQSAGRCVRVYSSTQITRTAASNACVALGGSLATVVDAADNAVILRLTTSNNIFWIGPTDVAVEGTWVTPSGGALPYTNWSGGAAPVTAAEDCAGFNDNGGTWTDYDCSTNRRYVCELPLAPLCPTGTTENTGRCYDFETANRTFAAARTFCQTYGAGYDLAVVGDATENEWIRSNLANAAYLGLTDAATEGTWLDVNGSAPAYTNWYAPFPDGGVAANCVSLSDTSGFWDDQACSSTRRYVCERAPVNCQTGTVERGGHCYKIETSGASFASARTTCQALGAGYDLITVDDAAEDTWLASQTVNDTWIGLSDAVTEGTFLWTDGAAPTYTNFDAEPNSGDASDCAYFDDANARWYDMPCGTARRAVCEGPQSPVICPSGFTLSGGRCYEFVNSTLTHAAAEANCQSLSAAAHLATVSSAAENARIVSLIGTNKSAWIGFTDQATEGTFTWIADEGSAYTAWAGEPNDKSSDDCGYTAGDTGVWKSDSCSSPKRAGICEGPAQSAAAAGTWDADCVAQVASVCGATCGTAGQGLCSPWLPTEQNPACPTLPDLSLGPACEGGVVPVCNHGGVDAPAGVTLAWFSANSGHYPTCTPDLDRRKDTPGDCVVPTPIPAGECVSITCPGMTNNAEIVVNPPDASQIAECNCADNWSLYDKNAVCGPPECSAGATQATLRKANLYVMVDRSTSMSGAKWDGTVAALRSFFASTQAAGVGVALEFFPLRAREVGDASGDGCGMDQGTCSPALCSNPFVSLGTLTADPAPTDAHEAALVATLQPNWLLGSTPSWPALVGALEWAEARQLTHPNEVHAVVFATDGQPYGSCNLGTGANTNTQLAVRAGTALANGVRTYTIGMQGANQAALDAIAASGGTSTSFFIDSADPSTIATDLRTALGRIVGQAASCSFTLPNPDLFDPTSATVTYRDSGGTETDLPQVAASGDCGTGWYYNDPSSPTVATLCPDSCATVRADDNARVEIHLGCPLPPPAGDGGGGGGGSLGSGAIRRRYEATCDGNRVPQWSFLTYRTTVAPDATLSFRLRTAPSAAELATATFLDVATIPTAPAVCELSGPAPTCPVDVFNLLGGGAVTRQPLLEIEASATAPTSIPSIDEIHLTYSCLDSQ